MQRSRKGASPRISQGASEATSAGGLLVAECLDAPAYPMARALVMATGPSSDDAGLFISCAVIACVGCVS